VLYVANNLKPLLPSSAPIPTIVAKTTAPSKVIIARSVHCRLDRPVQALDRRSASALRL